MRSLIEAVEKLLATPTFSAVCPRLDAEELEALAALREELESAKQKVVIVWTAQDIMDVENKHDRELTEEEALEILSEAEERLLDASVGCGWNVLDQVVSEWIEKDDARKTASRRCRTATSPC